MLHIPRIAQTMVFTSVLMCVSSGLGETTLSDFNDFNLDQVFASWTSATVVSATNAYSITASGFGSGYKAINVDATGETNLELTVTLSGSGGPTAPISGPIVSLVDADGTLYNWAWYGQTSGTHVLQASLTAPKFVSAAGSIAGLDLSKLTAFHLQDDPGTYTGQYSIKFQLLRLTGAPGLAITSPTYDPNTLQFTFTWRSAAGKSYTVLYAPDLATPFTPLATGIASGGTSTTNTVAMPGGNTGFLRVKQE